MTSGKKKKALPEDSGTAKIRRTGSDMDCAIILRDVLYEPHMIYNLILSRKMRQSGARMLFDDFDNEPLKPLIKIIEKRTGVTSVVEIETDGRLCEEASKPLSIGKWSVSQAYRSDF